LPRGQAGVWSFLESGAINIAFRVDEHVAALRKLHQKYQNVPMSLADACIVRMAELNERHAVLTLDADFLVYRKDGRTPLTIIHPTAI
jgi:predicted nucleic acid-binding protein